MRCFIPSAVAWLMLSAVTQAAGIEAIARPSDDRTLSFVIAGQIAEVTVKDGDRVQRGQLLARLDDAAEQVQLAQLKAQAADESRIEAAKAQADQRRVELKRLSSADRPPLEVDRAKLEVIISELSLQLARFEHRQHGLRARETEIHLDRMRLVSPIDGLVEQVFLQPGEAADRERPVVRLVKIDPLRIDVAVPVRQAVGLRVGRPAEVRMVDTDDRLPGKVVFMAAEADAASRTLTVRVEVSNPKLHRAGTHVRVTFPEPD
jgi:RND family efflux transporter MFP subunit